MATPMRSVMFYRFNLPTVSLMHLSVYVGPTCIQNDDDDINDNDYDDDDCDGNNKLLISHTGLYIILVYSHLAIAAYHIFCKNTHISYFPHFRSRIVYLKIIFLF